MDTCTHCVDEPLKCPECKCACEITPSRDLEDGDVVECQGCGEEWYVWLDELIDANEYHENYCDSEAAQKYEGMAYGNDEDDYSIRIFRNQDYYTDQ